MNKYFFFALILLTYSKAVLSQDKPQINITFSKLLATYTFVQQLATEQPSKNKELFESSKYNEQHFRNLVARFDTLEIYESYEFEGYPVGQKIPATTTSFLERNLINSNTVEEFKQKSFGLIPNSELFALANILGAFLPVYDSLIYLPNKEKFELKVRELNNFVDESGFAGFFEKGLSFYNSQWDNAILFDIAVVPSLSKGGFTAKAFLNNAMSEVPLSFKDNAVLFSVLMHEIYHILYDGQGLVLKVDIDSWFKENPSPNSMYAYLLLNEVLATALGNGYVYEELTGKPDKADWYNVKYINLMAKEIYPLVKSYLLTGESIDKSFIDEYIAIYDRKFSDWPKELAHILTNRYVLADNDDDLNYFRTHYPQASYFVSETPVSSSSLERMKETPFTKVIIISSDHERKLGMLKSAFSELADWSYELKTDFVYTTDLTDRTKLIVINSTNATVDELFQRAFKNDRFSNR